MKSFEDVFNRYCAEVESKDKDTTHKPGQVREKFTEIISAVGIDGNMLKVNIEEGDDIDAKLAAVTKLTVTVSDLGMMRETLYFGAPPLMLFASHTFA